jgi:MerR family copper efflux transcriptional regulator
MNIGELAAQTGVTAKTIRYYESIGLMTRAARADNGYRVYGERDMETLRFIQRSRGLGFSIKDVASLLSLWHDTARASAVVKNLAINQIEAIEGRIVKLEGIRLTLIHLANQCHGDSRPDCPILNELADGLATDDH